MSRMSMSTVRSPAELVPPDDPQAATVSVATTRSTASLAGVGMGLRSMMVMGPGAGLVRGISVGVDVEGLGAALSAEPVVDAVSLAVGRRDLRVDGHATHRIR